jgi:hypothetical protein
MEWLQPVNWRLQRATSKPPKETPCFRKESAPLLVFLSHIQEQIAVDTNNRKPRSVGKRKESTIASHSVVNPLPVLPDAIATDLASPERAEARSMTSSGSGAMPWQQARCVIVRPKVAS